jgi:hypothetical protein
MNVETSEKAESRATPVQARDEIRAECLIILNRAEPVPILLRRGTFAAPR